MEVCLDRFSHDYRPAPRPVEPAVCWWCGQLVHGGADMHKKCEWEHEVQEMEFGALLNMVLDKVTDGYTVDADLSRLEFWCNFKTAADALEVIEMLKARGATYHVGDMVKFEIGPSNGRLEFK
jgi:hypothetical protein